MIPISSFLRARTTVPTSFIVTVFLLGDIVQMRSHERSRNTRFWTENSQPQLKTLSMLSSSSNSARTIFSPTLLLYQAVLQVSIRTEDCSAAFLRGSQQVEGLDHSPSVQRGVNHRALTALFEQIGLPSQRPGGRNCGRRLAGFYS